MKKYKVVKSEDIFEKGDVFVENQDGTFSCKQDESYNGYKFSSVINISKNYIDKAVKEGVVVLVEDLVSLNETRRKIVKINTELTYLANKYQNDIDVTLAKYQLGEVSECQKAEAITVLSNLLKLTDHIKSILNSTSNV